MAVKIITETEFFNLFTKEEQDAIKNQIMSLVSPQTVKFIEKLAVGQSGTDVIYVSLSKTEDPKQKLFFKLKRKLTVVDRRKIMDQNNKEVWISPLAMHLTEVHWFDNENEYLQRRSAEILTHPTAINSN